MAEAISFPMERYEDCRDRDASSSGVSLSYWKCIFCPVQEETEAAIETHICEHLQFYPYVCSNHTFRCKTCDTGFAIFDQLAWHAAEKAHLPMNWCKLTNSRKIHILNAVKAVLVESMRDCPHPMILEVLNSAVRRELESLTWEECQTLRSIPATFIDILKLKDQGSTHRESKHDSDESSKGLMNGDSQMPVDHNAEVLRPVVSNPDVLCEMSASELGQTVRAQEKSGQEKEAIEAHGCNSTLNVESPEPYEDTTDGKKGFDNQKTEIQGVPLQNGFHVEAKCHEKGEHLENITEPGSSTGVLNKYHDKPEGIQTNENVQKELSEAGTSDEGHQNMMLTQSILNGDIEGNHGPVTDASSSGQKKTVCESEETLADIVDKSSDSRKVQPLVLRVDEPKEEAKGSLSVCDVPFGIFPLEYSVVVEQEGQKVKGKTSESADPSAVSQLAKGSKVGKELEEDNMLCEISDEEAASATKACFNSVDAPESDENNEALSKNRGIVAGDKDPITDLEEFVGNGLEDKRAKSVSYGLEEESEEMASPKKSQMGLAKDLDEDFDSRIFNGPTTPTLVGQEEAMTSRSSSSSRRVSLRSQTTAGGPSPSLSNTDPVEKEHKTDLKGSAQKQSMKRKSLLRSAKSSLKNDMIPTPSETSATDSECGDVPLADLDQSCRRVTPRSSGKSSRFLRRRREKVTIEEQDRKKNLDEVMDRESSNEPLKRSRGRPKKRRLPVENSPTKAGPSGLPSSPLAKQESLTKRQCLESESPSVSRVEGPRLPSYLDNRGGSVINLAREYKTAFEQHASKVLKIKCALCPDALHHRPDAISGHVFMHFPKGPLFECTACKAVTKTVRSLLRHMHVKHPSLDRSHTIDRTHEYDKELRELFHKCFPLLQNVRKASSRKEEIESRKSPSPLPQQCDVDDEEIKEEPPESEAITGDTLLPESVTWSEPENESESPTVSSHGKRSTESAVGGGSSPSPTVIDPNLKTPLLTHLQSLDSGIQLLSIAKSSTCGGSDATEDATPPEAEVALETHFKVLPYKCNVCQRQFSTKFLCKGHIKRHGKTFSACCTDLSQAYCDELSSAIEKFCASQPITALRIAITGKCQVGIDQDQVLT